MLVEPLKFNCDFCNCLVIDCQWYCDGIHTGMYPQFPGTHRIYFHVKNIGRYYMDIELEMGQEIIIPARLLNEYSSASFAVVNLQTRAPVYLEGQCSRGEQCYQANVIRPIFLGSIEKINANPCDPVNPAIVGGNSNVGSSPCNP